MKNLQILNDNSLNFLKKYIETPSPTGMEWQGQKIWLDYVKQYTDDYFTDNYGTAVGVINPDADYKVVIEAHADEISWMVHYITDEGFLYLKKNGGSDHQIAPSKKVWLHTDNGPVEGIFGWPAIHARDSSSESTPLAKNLFIDVGCNSKEEVLELGIHVGTLVTYQDGLTLLNDRYFTGRAIDNRMGGFIIAEAARYIRENNINLPFGLYVTNSVQEEVGMRGAQMITENIKPDVAIITDMCHDTQTPMVQKQTEGDFKGGNGPVITYAPAVQHQLRDLIIEAANEKEIPFQRLARQRITGTDTDAFAFSNAGVPSSLISVPIRYMHTTVESAHKDDVENTIRLFVESLQKIKNGHDFRYIT